MTRLRFLTAGESHGPSLTGILEGMPAGLTLDSGPIDAELERRQHGRGAGARMEIERDRARITAGVLGGVTTGAPIALTIENLDHKAWASREIPPMTIPRPGHADLTGAVKYGYRDLRRSLERASARETAMRVALGAVCRAFLRELGVKIVGYVTAIGGVEAAGLEPTSDPRVYTARFARAERSDVRCPDGAAARKMGAAIDAAKRGRDSLGGVVEAAALFVPPGLGSHVQWDRRLDAALAAAVMGLPSVKGVEIGAGFRGAGARGTKAHDAIALRGGDLTRPTNRAGGIEGGISNGAPVVVRAALKPLATTVKPQDSVDLAAGKAAKTRYERSDVCQVPRAVPIVEAAVALVVADALLEKLGGDSLDEVRPRFEALRSARLDDLPMDSEPWRFGYDGRA